MWHMWTVKTHWTGPEGPKDKVLSQKKVIQSNSWSRGNTMWCCHSAWGRLCATGQAGWRAANESAWFGVFPEGGELTWPLIPPLSTHWWSGWPRGLLGWGLPFHFVSLQPDYGPCRKVTISSIFMVGWGKMGDWLIDSSYIMYSWFIIDDADSGSSSGTKPCAGLQIVSNLNISTVNSVKLAVWYNSWCVLIENNVGRTVTSYKKMGSLNEDEVIFPL